METRPWKNFSQKEVEKNLAKAFSELTDTDYTVDIRSIELIELTQNEKNHAVLYKRIEPVTIEMDKIVLVLSRHSSPSDEQEEDELFSSVPTK